MNTNIFDDYDEQSQEMLKGLNFLSLNDVNRGITTEDPFKNIRTTKTARKISNEIAMESPFGKRSAFYKPLVVAQTINTLETFKVTIRIMVDDDLSLVREKYKTETVEDHTIKLYIAVEDETLVVKQHHDDLRHAGIRLSNIIEISGVVLGDKIFARFNDNPEEKENYITKIAQDLIDVDSQLEPLKALLKEKFDYYMAHKRSTLFPLGLVGQLIQQELKKDLQEFWKPVLNSIAKEIRTLKMDDEKYWQPYTPDGKLKSISKFTPLVGKAFTNKESYIQSFLQPFDQIDKLLQNYLNLNKIEADNKFSNQAHNTKLKKALAQIYSLFKDIFNYFKSGLLNFIATSADKVYQLNAFLVGVINGVIEFVASLFDLVGFLSGLLSGDAVMLWQAVKKEFERLKEEGAFTYLFKAIGKFFDTLSKRYNTTQGKYTIVKHLGEDLIGIVEVVLGAIAVFKAGKVIISNSKTTFDSFKKAVDDIFEKRNKEVDGILHPKTRVATQLDIDELAKIRKLFNAGKNKNVAFTRGEIGGKKIDLFSRSGEPKGTPKNFDNFKQIKPENYHYKDGPLNRIYDSEQKQIEYLYETFKHDKTVGGKIEIVSDLKICRNCDDIIFRFKKDFPNIEIVKVWVKESL